MATETRGPSRRPRSFTSNTPNSETECGEAIAPRAAEAFHQPLGAQLGQIVAELAELVVAIRELLAGQDARMQLTCGPVGDERARLKHRLQQAHHPLIVQLQSRDTAVADARRFGQCRQLAGVNGAGEQFARQRSFAWASFWRSRGRFSSRRPMPKCRVSFEQVSVRRMRPHACTAWQTRSGSTSAAPGDRRRAGQGEVDHPVGLDGAGAQTLGVVEIAAEHRDWVLGSNGT